MSRSARHAGDRARPLRLAPFRALRYNPARVPDLGAVTCPPYDVIGPDHVAAWEAADPHNIVRLILPRDGEDRYAQASHDLQRWIASDVFVQDETPALYVYEHSSHDAVALGLVGAMSLHDPSEQRILAHEDVFPGPVADRTALMSATGAQFEPILLTYEGDGPASHAVDSVVTTAPTFEVSTTDAATHRLWRITDPAMLATIQSDLSERQALIADGHHRYSAYLALRDRPAAPPGAPHSYGLAMLVDAHRHPLRLGAIHRSVAGLPLRDAVAAARRSFRSVQVHELDSGVDVLTELRAARAGSTGPVLAVADSHALVLLSQPDADLVQASMPAGRSELWRGLDASIACEFLLPKRWGVDDADRRVAYHHDVDDALTRADQASGVAVVLNPARHSDVMAIAARGERMPRKSTSFGPKPRTGLLMRLLDDRAFATRP